MPNTIPAKVYEWKVDEAVGSGTIYPGFLLALNSSQQVIPHNVFGGFGECLVATEDGLQGKTKTDAYSSGARVTYMIPNPGDEMYLKLKQGQNIAYSDPLTSNGDGTVVKARVLPQLLYSNVAVSTAHANSTDEALFDKNYSLPANSLRAGDVIKVRALVRVTGVNATPTLTVNLRYGGLGGTAIATTGAISVVADDVLLIEAEIQIRTIGATGTLIANNIIATEADATIVVKHTHLVSTAFDSTAAKVIGVSADWNAAHASNSARLEMLTIQLLRPEERVVAYAREAVDLSAASADGLLLARFA